MESLPHNTGSTFLLPCNKRNRERDVMTEDRISELSDDILVLILSRLTMKEAARTSLLSKRWRYLWTWFTGYLNFDNPQAMRALCYPFFPFLKSEPLDVERPKFVSWLNRVLRLHQGPSIEGLRICFDVVSEGDIDNWIKFAVDKRVQKLELDFSRVKPYLWYVDQYNFPSHLDSYSSFRSLTALSLMSVGVTGEVLQHLLSYCPFLEELSVRLSASLTSLKVSGPSLKLKHLKLTLVPNLQHLEIDAPNLMSFEYGGPKIPISFRNVSNIAEVYFSGFYGDYAIDNLRQFSNFLVQLHTLGLIVDSIHSEEPTDYHLPELPNLKHFEMTISSYFDGCLVPCAAFLKASPSLHKFTLKFITPLEVGAVRTVKDHPYFRHMKLSFKVLELEGAEMEVAESELVMYLMESAKLLEKIILDPCSPLSVGGIIEPIMRETDVYKCYRKRSMEFAAKFPSMEFVIP